LASDILSGALTRRAARALAERHGRFRPEATACV
jgi:hypothetical protein